MKIKLIKKQKSVESVWDAIEQKIAVDAMFVLGKNMDLQEIKNDVNKEYVSILWEGKCFFGCYQYVTNKGLQKDLEVQIINIYSFLCKLIQLLLLIIVELDARERIQVLIASNHITNIWKRITQGNVMDLSVLIVLAMGPSIALIDVAWS